jgi:hypothetical protein
MNFEVEFLQALAEDQYRRLVAEADRERLVAQLRGPEGAGGGGGAGRAVARWLRGAADHLDPSSPSPSPHAYRG